MSHATPLCNEEPMDICEPENRPGVDEADFRSALGRFASGVTVVTSLVGNTSPIGATVTAFSSVSLDPPLVLFCLTSESATFTAIKETGKCAINILAEDQEHLSRAFSQR
ncbi:MAG: flavin reductase family protein, partial [Pseudomonadota bacterium]